MSIISGGTGFRRWQVEKINGKMNLALDALDDTADAALKQHYQHAQNLHRLHEKMDRFAAKMPPPSPATPARPTVSYIPKLNLSSLGLGKREPAEPGTGPARVPGKREHPVHREASVDSSCQTDPLPVWPHPPVVPLVPAHAGVPNSAKHMISHHHLHAGLATSGAGAVSYYDQSCKDD